MACHEAVAYELVLSALPFSSTATMLQESLEKRATQLEAKAEKQQAQQKQLDELKEELGAQKKAQAKRVGVVHSRLYTCARSRVTTLMCHLPCRHVVA